jgi:hypothetical protein
MATTTTNFGWDIPQSTDLVKDGATAIAALGQDIDTAFVDFKGGTTGQVLKKTSGTDLDVEWGTASSGLTLINTTSFSGVASQSLPASTFTSTYDDYFLVMSISTTGNSNQDIQMRTGVTNTATGYDYAAQGSYTNNTGFNFGSTGAISWAATQTTSSTAANFICYIRNPFATANTYYHGNGYMRNSTNGYVLNIGGQLGNSTSYDSLTILNSSGNMTGKITVFGVAK